MTADLESVDSDLPVPATPDWSVRDLMAHVVGVAEDVATGNVTEYAQLQWTRAQVARRSQSSVAELVDEWAAILPDLLERTRHPVQHGLDPMYGTAPVVDLVLHEGDLAYAAGRVPPVSGAAALLGDRLRLLAVQIDAAGLPALAVETEDRRWIVGAGEPAATVRSGPFALARALHGRRTPDQVRGFDWVGDPAPYLDLFPGWVFAYPTVAIEE